MTPHPSYPPLSLVNARGDDDYEDVIATLTLAATDVINPDPKVQFGCVRYMADALWRLGEPYPAARPAQLAAFFSPYPARDALIIAAGIMCMLHEMAREDAIDPAYGSMKADAVGKIRAAWDAVVQTEMRF